MRAALVSLLMVTLAGCSPAQRVAVGGGIAAAGLGLGYIAAESMAESCSQPGEPKEGCKSPSEGTPIVAMGVLGIVLVGGAVVATGLEHPEPKPSRAVPVARPPVEPGPLDQADAVAMATAQLVLMVGSAKTALARLQGVDDSESSLRVEGRHAQLSSLRVLIGSDRDWRRVGACYELENEWRLTWLGTSPRCLPSR